MKIRYLTSTDALHLIVLCVLTALSPLAVARTDAGWWLPAGYVTIAIAICLLARGTVRAPSSLALRVLHTAYPVVAVLLIFWSLYWIVPAVNDGPWRDDLLIRWDEALVGDAVGWFRSIERPWLTEVMHVFYLAYFVLPVVLLLPLLRRENALAESIFVLCLSFYLCYVGYGALKAMGPRYFVYESNVMQGLWLTQTLRDVIDFLEPNKADVFPSAHAAVTLVVNALALRHVRRLGVAMLPVTAGILFSLVYCRYHYVADVLAGVLWAAVTVGVGLPLHALWEGRARGR